MKKIGSANSIKEVKGYTNYPSDILILDIIAKKGSVSCPEILFLTDFSIPKINQTMTSLKNFGFVTVSTRRFWTYYKLTGDGERYLKKQIGDENE